MTDGYGSVSSTGDRDEECRFSASPDDGEVSGESELGFEPSLTMPGAPVGGGADTFDVFLPDDRRAVVAGGRFPWRAICLLRATGGDGAVHWGTGWLVGPRTVATAGHVVLPRFSSSFAARVEIVPGRTASGGAHPPVVATELRTTPGWQRRRDPAFDLGAILLPEPLPALGERLGYFGLASLSDATVATVGAMVAGYPVDRGRVLVAAPGRLRAVAPSRLHHTIDTEDGESGGPIFTRTPEGDLAVLGIHTDGFPSRNEGLRFTRGAIRVLRLWKNL